MISTRRALAVCFALNLLLVAVAVGQGLLRTGNPSRYFGEGRWTTLASCVQIFVAASFAFLIYLHRRKSVGGSGPRLWILISAGFAFLILDDALQIHEQIDTRLHRALKLRPTALTDRLDDMIIGLYALTGLVVLWRFRRELLLFPSMLKALAVGCVCAFGSIACDTISNRPDIFLWLTGDDRLSRRLEGWFAVGDGGFQLLAVGCFVAAFYLAWKAARAGIAIAGTGESFAIPSSSLAESSVAAIRQADRF